jgi:excisionase family DNA binding protein
MMRQYDVVQTGHPCLVGSFATAFLSSEENVMTSVTNERWLSLDEIADYLGIKRDTVYKWIDRRQMPAHKVGSLWKFKRDEVDEWVRSGEAGNGKNDRKPR